MNENGHASARRVFLLHVVLAIGLALLLARLLAAYWAYFHMGTAGGSGASLVVIVLPVVTLLFCAIAYAIYLIARRRRWTPVSHGLLGAGCLVVSVVLVFGAEVWRTANYQTETGEPVDVFEFVEEWL
jgi:FtsH-binding integral membrane protein